MARVGQENQLEVSLKKSKKRRVSSSSDADVGTVAIETEASPNSALLEKKKRKDKLKKVSARKLKKASAAESNVEPNKVTSDKEEKEPTVKKSKKRKLSVDISPETAKKSEEELNGTGSEKVKSKSKKRRKSFTKSTEKDDSEEAGNIPEKISVEEKEERPDDTTADGGTGKAKMKSKNRRNSTKSDYGDEHSGIDASAKTEGKENDKEDVNVTPKSKSSSRESKKEKKSSSKKKSKKRRSSVNGVETNDVSEENALENPASALEHSKGDNADEDIPNDDEGNTLKGAEKTPDAKEGYNQVEGANTDAIAHADAEPQKRPRRGSEPGQPFKRVREDSVQFLDERLRDNSFYSKMDTYGEKAHNDLVVTRGKGFRKEKTKKKRLNHHGGKLTNTVNSFKFPDDSE